MDTSIEISMTPEASWAVHLDVISTTAALHHTTKDDVPTWIFFYPTTYVVTNSNSALINTRVSDVVVAVGFRSHRTGIPAEDERRYLRNRDSEKYKRWHFTKEPSLREARGDENKWRVECGIFIDFPWFPDHYPSLDGVMDVVISEVSPQSK